MDGVIKRNRRNLTEKVIQLKASEQISNAYDYKTPLNINRPLHSVSVLREMVPLIK